MTYMKMLNDGLAKLEALDAEIGKLNFTSNSYDIVLFDKDYVLDHIIAFVAGFVGGIFSNSEAIKNFLDKIHLDASKPSPKTTVGSLLHHKGDLIDCPTDLNDYIKRNGDKLNRFGLHRLYYGHDIFSSSTDNPFRVLTCQHGLIRGILQTVRHLTADTFSKAGLPIPFSSYFDFSADDGTLLNWLDKLATNISKGTGLRPSQAFSRIFSLRMQDVLAQGLTWAIISSWILLRKIDDKIYKSQLKLFAYGANLLTNISKGLIAYGIPYISWPTLLVTAKEFYVFYKLNQKDLIRLEELTNTIVLENIKLEQEVFGFGRGLKSYKNTNGYIKEIKNTEQALFQMMKLS